MPLMSLKDFAQTYGVEVQFHVHRHLATLIYPNGSVVNVPVVIIGNQAYIEVAS